MNSPQMLFVLQWLIRDTFLQAFSSRVFWGMMLATGFCILFCLGISIEGGGSTKAPDDPYDHFQYHPTTGAPLQARSEDLGKLHLLFGVMKVGLARDREGTVQLIEVIFGTWIAGAFGVLVTLIWTSCWLPEFLQPSQITVLLAKPSPRWLYLVGKLLGVTLFIALQATLFFVGTWAALGLRTGVWHPHYLAGIPLLLLHFASFYGFSMVLAVFTRSPVASVLGTMFFWIMCVLVNYGRHAAIVLPDVSAETAALSPVTLMISQASYWILPKPLDYLVMLERSLGSSEHMATLGSIPEYASVFARNEFDPVLIVVSSILFLGFCLFLASRQFAKTDY